jgi:hypothetical protein
MVKEKQPNLVFFMETKLQASKMEILRVKLGFGSVFVVHSVGCSGGLALMWREDACVDIQNYSRRHINAIVQIGDYPHH